MLNEHSHEAFRGPHHRPVKHHRAMGLSILADALFIAQTFADSRVAQGRLCRLPYFFAARVLFLLQRIVQRETYPVVRQAIRLEDLLRQVDSTIKLLLNLVRAYEDVGIVLRDTAYTR